MSRYMSEDIKEAQRCPSEKFTDLHRFPVDLTVGPVWLDQNADNVHTVFS